MNLFCRLGKNLALQQRWLCWDSFIEAAMPLNDAHLAAVFVFGGTEAAHFSIKVNAIDDQAFGVRNSL